MPIEITMPKLSDTMTDGTLVKWLKKEGDAVKPGDILAEVETDKATQELEAFEVGTVAKIMVPEGAKTPIGGVIVVLAKPGEDVKKIATLAGSPPPASVAKVVATPAEVKAQTTGVAVSATGAVITAVETQTEPSAAETIKEGAEHIGDGRVRISPLARRIADELKIDITTLRGTGPDGRVIKRDVEQAAAQRPSGAAPSKAPSSGMGTIPTVAPVKAQSASLPTPSASAKLESKKIPLSSIRQTIARRLLESKLTIPHFYLSVDVQMDALLTLRGQANAQLAPEKLSVTDFIARAVAVALARIPAMNTSFGGTEIVQHGTVNLGIAVALDDGLVVPVLRDAHLKGVRQLSAEIKQLAELARSRKLKADQITGSTFTISNLGMYGVKNFQAIVNPPEAAILAVGGTSAQAVAKDGQVAVAEVMNLSLSCDHRVIDGATGAKFLGEIKTLLEQPLAMLI